MDNNRQELTQLLIAWSSGDRKALNMLMPLVIDELRRLARGHLRRERDYHTLQPTALINELYLRLAGHEGLQWASRIQFFAFASGLMRGILIDHYRAQQTAKRGGGALVVSLDETIALPARQQDVDLLALDDALRSLESLDPRQCRIVELRFFGGLTLEEISHAMGISVATVRREWAAAKSWLYREISQK